MVETLQCDSCRKSFPVDLIDCKDDGTGNYTICLCRQCYGPGWLPAVGKAEDYNSTGTAKV